MFASEYAKVREMLYLSASSVIVPQPLFSIASSAVLAIISRTASVRSERRVKSRLSNESSNENSGVDNFKVVNDFVG